MSAGLIARLRRAALFQPTEALEVLICEGVDALEAAEQENRRLREALEPTGETRDYLTRTIATIRNHRDAENCWPQWANLLADEVERMWAALAAAEEPR